MTEPHVMIAALAICFFITGCAGLMSGFFIEALIKNVPRTGHAGHGKPVAGVRGGTAFEKAFVAAVHAEHITISTAAAILRFLHRTIHQRNISALLQPNPVGEHMAAGAVSFRVKTGDIFNPPISNTHHRDDK